MKKILNVVLATLIAFSLNAQTLSIENVNKVELRSNGEIKEVNEVKGYYFLYVSDKVSKKENEYTMKITDANLKPIKDIVFVDSKDVQILETSFNGKDLIFLFYNSKAMLFEFKVYGSNGTEKFTYTREITKKEKAYLEQTYFQFGDETRYKGLFPIEGKGFVSVMPSREKKDFTVEINFYSSIENKEWSYIPTEGSKRLSADYLGMVGNTLFFNKTTV